MSNLAHSPPPAQRGAPGSPLLTETLFRELSLAPPPEKHLEDVLALGAALSSGLYTHLGYILALAYSLVLTN
jgi:hypothetical protein